MRLLFFLAVLMLMAWPYPNINPFNQMGSKPKTWNQVVAFSKSVIRTFSTCSINLSNLFLQHLLRLFFIFEVGWGWSNHTHSSQTEVCLSLSLCISHITDATTIMWSVGCSLFLHLSIFFAAPLRLCLSLGLSGHRELWSEGIVGGRGREINTTSRWG